MKNEIWTKKSFLFFGMMLFFYIAWFIVFIARKNIINENVVEIIENITLGIIGIIIMVILIFKNDSSDTIPLIVFLPFMFARPFDAYSLPKMIYGACGLALIGILIHCIRYKPKLKLGHLFYGILALGIAMILGGINIQSIYRWQQFFIMFAAVGIIIVLYIFMISSSKKKSFSEISLIFTCLGVLLSLQTITFFIFSNDLSYHLAYKQLDVGWGISNNIALILLMTAPFTVYLIFTKNKTQSIIFSILAFLQIFSLIFTFSRGAILALFIEIIIFMIMAIKKAIKNEYPWKIILLILGCFMAIGILLFWKVVNIYEEFWINFKKMIINMDFSSMTERMKIYTNTLKNMDSHWLLGQGIFSPMYNGDELTGGYSWAHSTILHTLSTMGLVGVGALFFHFFQKYYVLLKKPNYIKLIILVSFAGSGLYGLFDVSYYFINYMIPLVCIIILTDSYFDNLMIETIENIESYD